MAKWDGKLSRIQAIEIIDQATDKDDPFWENIVADYYDEETDTMPSIMDVFSALGITKAEYQEASGADNIEWPDATPPARDDVAALVEALEPFARMWVWDKDPDYSILRFKSDTNDVSEKFCQIFAGDIRRAREALARVRDGEKK